MKLTIVDEALDDLDDIALQAEDDKYFILALLEDIENDSQAASRLLDQGAWPIGPDRVDVMPFRFFFRKGYDIWRMKVYELGEDLLPYRLIYAYDYRHREIYILAVMHRRVDYENDPEFTARIRASYLALNLPVSR